jgi:mannose-6-phosphate isomerase-like protein (cupin superfamily)
MGFEIYRHFHAQGKSPQGLRRSLDDLWNDVLRMRKLRDFLPPSIYERAVKMHSTASHRVALTLGLAAGLVMAPQRSSFAQTKAKPPSEADQAAQAIEKALQKHGGDVHRCFEKVLADRLDVAGKVEVSVDVGKAGKVTAAKVLKIDKSAPGTLASCIEKAALGWTLDGIEAGAAVVLPFSFKAQQSQYVVNGADVPDRALGAPAPGKAKVGPKRDVPFTVKVLADETNVKAEKISLTLLSIGPASRVAMHRHPHSAKILYLVKGHARLLGPEGVAPVKLDEGAAAFVPAGYPHVIENMGRQSTAIFLQAFSPPGPERVYRDPTDARGRAEFEVIRDPANAKTPEGDAKIIVTTAAEAKPVSLPRNMGSAKTLVDAAASKGMSLALLEFVDGAEVQSKGDPSSTEVLYLVAGGGSLKVAGETLPLGPESMVYLPHGTAYAMKLAAGEKGDKILAAQFRVPAIGKPSSVPTSSGAPRK